MVGQAKVSYQGREHRFKAFEAKDLPSLVQLTIQFPQKGMLPEPEEEARQVALQLLQCAAEDNGWPKDEDGRVRIQVVSCFWSRYLQADGTPHPTRGYWLIRFRVPLAAAEHIRLKQNGLIQVVTDTFLVHHARGPWRGDRKAVLVHENDPVE